MATNKERLELLETALGGVQDGLAQMAIGFGDRMQRLEDSMKTLSEAMVAIKDTFGHNKPNKDTGFKNKRETGDGSGPTFFPRTAKLEFPRYSGDDPTEWFHRVAQFFDYQGTLDNQKVSLASFHLEGEANQWWQWMNRTYKEESRIITWDNFEEELWARFGPTDCEDFDEALSRVK